MPLLLPTQPPCEGGQGGKSVVQLGEARLLPLLPPTGALPEWMRKHITNLEDVLRLGRGAGARLVTLDARRVVLGTLPPRRGCEGVQITASWSS